MHVFFAEITNGQPVILSEEESHHAVKALRLREGQQVVVTNGKGAWCQGILVSCHAKGSLISITETIQQSPRPFRLHLAAAPTKNIDRFEWLLEKVTECGIDEITPLICEKSERTVVKHERLEKLLVAAMKQSMRAYLPILNPLVKFHEFLKRDFEGVKLVAHCRNSSRKSLSDVYHMGQNVTMIIGPEGDFSEAEVQKALERGFVPVSLGPHRLRTETAALAACVQLNFMNGM
jgi:16S rRNA (uracil1498-N3)-methyltransferase